MFHRWVSAEEGMSQCLSCGGVWVSDPKKETKTGLRGDPAIDCATGFEHHYANECGELVCSRNPECNCLLCYS